MPRYFGERNSKQVDTAIIAGENKRYGLNLPHFVCVLSTAIPMIGSLKASKIRATKISIPAWIGSMPTASVKKMSANVDINV